jgi:hypothetical protein
LQAVSKKLSKKHFREIATIKNSLPLASANGIPGVKKLALAKTAAIPGG